ncbi:phage virion morphogenesis protein [Blastomonas fulva]|uniref:phage virion morphogenesis protein n=1 Tax=Blastomonas fulva TaxID=1550728 RepID=UPI0025A3CCF3|nr:phage virion morphogenesis protein [Blastomonas fulva]MDM7928666.1 phage virion morphogenesis protein [Blastomonas fulva]MDM7964452.1 phage virion morphogenesis protein [Blastomonas fulva]
MAGASLSMRVAGSAAIDARLAALAAANGDLSDLMDGIGLYLESSTIERFDTETDPDGKPWEKSQRAKDQGGKTLTDSARLKTSITHRSSATDVEVGTNVICAGPHQHGMDESVSVGAHSRTIRQAFGRSLPGGLTIQVGAFDRQMKMPKRSFLGINAEDETEILALAEDYERDAVPEIDG